MIAYAHLETLLCRSQLLQKFNVSRSSPKGLSKTGKILFWTSGTDAAISLDMQPMLCMHAGPGSRSTAAAAAGVQQQVQFLNDSL